MNSKPAMEAKVRVLLRQTNIQHTKREIKNLGGHFRSGDTQRLLLYRVCRRDEKLGHLRFGSFKLSPGKGETRAKGTGGRGFRALQES